MPALSSALVLNKYILHLFGVKDLEALAENLKDSSLEGYDENNVSYFHLELVKRLFANPLLTAAQLRHYDENIFAHTERISEKRPTRISWKYFQYLALLFTEIYLDQYFTNAAGLRQQLDNFRAGSKPDQYTDFRAIKPFDEDDLTKLAFWNATGSGKTLLMHINILQYRHYLRRHGRQRELNRVIVLTPNEGLSRQHLREFAESNLEAELFDKQTGTLFQGQKIEIIDINKFRDKSGTKTVAIEAFEGNNLVLVDEGHRGTGGNEWKRYRASLAAEGFSFEYSATFGQAVASQAGAAQKELLSEYGKATLFDYSYRYFYQDGYGKDYQILNLDEAWDDDNVTQYLVACLLTFYDQLLVFKDHHAALLPFLVAKPLAIFVGGRVAAVRKLNEYKGDKREVSDVVPLLQFLHTFVHTPTQSIEWIKRLLEQQDTLLDQHNQAIFRNAFTHVRGQRKTAADVYRDLLNLVFNSTVAGAGLHLDNLKGQDGEIGLRVGNAPYFGVINVGDDAKLLKLCADTGFSVTEKPFSTSLFQAINQDDSPVNVLIGSKKFSEGWSSWRVSTMGLLNIGRGEGSEIIQLFGRGVRLKGYQFSLKRSTALDLNSRPDEVPKVLPTLETLRIFGLRAEYMRQFRDMLAAEGLPDTEEREQFSLRIHTTVEDLPGKKLKLVQVQSRADFKRAEVVMLPLKTAVPKVQVDWYPKVQMAESQKKPGKLAASSKMANQLTPENLAFVNWNAVYFELEKFKNDRGWTNLLLNRDELPNLFTSHNWYELFIPIAQLEVSHYGQVRNWQEIVTALLKGYCDKAYNFQKSRYYSQFMEVAELTSQHPNFEKEYRVAVRKEQTTLIQQLTALQTTLLAGPLSSTVTVEKPDFLALHTPQHLYDPLLYVGQKWGEDVVQVKPVPLNKGEKNFVEAVKACCESNPAFFANKELYLLRNISRRGIGFFEASNFYPDFIVWLVVGNQQYVSFIDPKGLRQIQGFTDPKIALYRKLREQIQPQLGDAELHLNSFILSNTLREELTYWKGADTLADFNAQHVYFEKQADHVLLMLKSSMV